MKTTNRQRVASEARRGYYAKASLLIVASLQKVEAYEAKISFFPFALFLILFC